MSNKLKIGQGKLGRAITIVLLLSFLLPAATSPVQAEGSAEQTSKFLPANTTAYFTFNCGDANFQTFQDVFLSKPELGLTRDFLLAQIKEKWGIDYDTEVKPWLTEVAVATLYTGSSKGIIFFLGTLNTTATENALTKWLSHLSLTTPAPVHHGVAIKEATRTLEGDAKKE